MKVSPMVGKPTEASMLVNIPRLVTAYFTGVPDPAVPGERIAFGTSGHRGSSIDKSFNERHLLAVTQDICLYRAQQKINGSLFLGIDGHALSEPAFASALEVRVGDGVDVMIGQKDGYSPTSAVSQTILVYNRGRMTGFADGLVIAPSHNPLADGAFKDNSPNGGSSGPEVQSDRSKGERVS